MLPIKSLLPGVIAALAIVMTIVLSLSGLVNFALQTDNLSLYFDNYIIHILLITCWQAGLSTLLSITIAIIVAKALTLVDFYGKTVLLKIMSLTFFLPSLIVVTGIISVYGQNGFLVKFCHFFGLDLYFSIYGLKGILLANIFLNFPYACQLFYYTLVSVPIEQKKLAMQLNFSQYGYFKIIELPRLKQQILPVATLIFMLCFSSFSTVLALGGGPKYTTFEVAIYQAIRDFDLLQAIVLAGIQLICSFFFLFLMKNINKNRRLTFSFAPEYIRLPIPLWGYFVIICTIFIGTIFILAPLFAIIFDGIYYFKWSILSISLGLTILYSLMIALGSATITLFLALLLLWTNSRLLLQNRIHSSNSLMMVGNLILMIPSMVLASGFFLLFFSYAENPFFVFLLMVISNGLTALPFILRNLETPMQNIVRQYHYLSQTLMINGWRHLYLIEFRSLKQLIAISFGFAFLLSLGDFGIIALFGKQTLNGYSLTTLPYFLYEQIAHYRYQDGAVIALLFLILSMAIMLIIDRNQTHYDQTQ